MTLIIIGAGGHAKSIYDIIRNKKKVFFDKNKKKFKIGKKIMSVKSDYKSLNKFKKNYKVVIAIGNNYFRKNNYFFLKKKKFNFTTLIHPKSYQAYGSKIGEGSVLMQGSLVNTDTIIGKNCIVNTNASIDHDCVIQDHSNICPGAILGGNVKIGKNCWIGLGVKIIQNCIIGDNVFIAAGSIVTKNIKSNSFVKGIPAKYEKQKLAKF